MDKWEYLTTFLNADIENAGARDFINKTWPAYQPRKFAPQALALDLNGYGEKGWEVIHVEPIWMGNNADVAQYYGGNTQSATWTHTYFVVMKRKKESLNE